MVTPTIQQQAPGATSRTKTSQGRSAPSNDDREDRPIGDAFGALLAISRGTIGEQIKSDGNRATAQMFDAKGKEVGGDRMSQLNKEYRSAVDDKSDRLKEARTGVDARGQTALVEAEGADRGRANERGLKTKGDPPKAQDHFAQLRSVGPRNEGTTAARSPGNEAAQVDTETQSRSSGSKFTIDAPPPVETARAVSGSIGANAIAATGSSTATSVAEAVGELMGASRVGESQGARASASSQGAADQRASSNDRQTQTAARAKEQPAPKSASESKLVRENNRVRFDKLVGSMRLRMGEHRSTAQMRLNPPELGSIRIDVRLVGDRLVVAVQAETDAAREVLSQRAEGLKATLREHGVLVDAFEVVTNTSDSSSNETFVGGDAGGAKQFNGGEMRASSSPVSRVAQGGVLEDYDGSEVAGIAASAPTVAGETRLDIRI